MPRDLKTKYGAKRRKVRSAKGNVYYPEKKKKGKKKRGRK